MNIKIIEDPQTPKSEWANTQFLPSEPEFGFVIRIQPLLKKYPLRFFVVLCHEFIHVAFELYALQYGARKRKLKDHHKFLSEWDRVIELDMMRLMPKVTRRKR